MSGDRIKLKVLCNLVKITIYVCLFFPIVLSFYSLELIKLSQNPRLVAGWIGCDGNN